MANQRTVSFRDHKPSCFFYRLNLQCSPSMFFCILISRPLCISRNIRDTKNLNASIKIVAYPFSQKLNPVSRLFSFAYSVLDVRSRVT